MPVTADMGWGALWKEALFSGSVALLPYHITDFVPSSWELLAKEGLL